MTFIGRCDETNGRSLLLAGPGPAPEGAKANVVQILPGRRELNGRPSPFGRHALLRFSAGRVISPTEILWSFIRW